MLAGLAPQEAAAALERSALHAHTRFTVTSREALLEILAQVRAQDFALNDQELEIGLRSIAVPVRNVVGVTVAAMNVSVQASRLSRRELIDNALPPLRAAAERLGAQLAP